jgi:hypothetical protein
MRRMQIRVFYVLYVCKYAYYTYYTYARTRIIRIRIGIWNMPVATLGIAAMPTASADL